MEYYVSGYDEEIYTIARSNVEDTIRITESGESMNEKDSIGEMEYTNTFANLAWGCTILTSFVVWTVCIVSLILNIMRKNTGKAIVSGIGIMVPMASIFLTTLGRFLLSPDDEIIFGIIPLICGVVLQIIFIIMPFIFCFSKNKNVNANNVNANNVNANNVNVQ